jgi:hypothetical protein
MDEHKYIKKFENDNWFILTNAYIEKNPGKLFTTIFTNAQKVKGIGYKRNYDTKIVEIFYVFEENENYMIKLPFVKDYFRLATENEIKKSKLMRIFSNKNY